MAGTERSTSRPITIDEWFSQVGRGNLQDFQDCFTADTGIALSLLGRAGDRLLVSSKDKWFCSFSKTHYEHRCNIGADCLIHRLIKRYESRLNYEATIASCDFGLTEFYVPVYHDNRLIAFWQGGGFTLSDRYRADMLSRKFDVLVLDPDELKRFVRRLVATTRLLNVRPGAGVAQSDGLRSAAVFADKLTRREREVAELVCHGMSNREVAQQLVLSEKTIKSHMNNILSKLGVRDRTQLVFEFNNRHDSDRIPSGPSRMSA